MVPLLPVRTAGQLARTIFTRGTLGRQLRKANALPSPASLCKKPQKMVRRRLRKALAVHGRGSYLPLLCSLFVLVLGLRTYPE
jgi:hypothetical protein